MVARGGGEGSEELLTVGVKFQLCNKNKFSGPVVQHWARS